MAIDIMDLGWLAAAIAASLAAAKLANFVLARYVKKITEKTRTTLDDRLLDAAQGPVFASLVAVGLYLALALLPSFSPFGEAIGQVFSVAAIAIAAYSGLVLSGAAYRWYAEEGAPGNKAVSDLIPVFRRITSAFITILAAMMALGQLGIEVTPLLASLGIAGLAVALAFQDTLANFFAGIYLTVDRPIRSGDYIRIEGDEEGYVEKIGWRNAMMRTLAGNIVIVPNSKLSQVIITNYHLPEKEMSVVIPVSVSYDSDLAKVERVVAEVAEKVQRAVPGAVRSFKPFIRYSGFAESGIEFSAIVRVNEFVDQYLVRHEFIKALHARFRKEKIEIPYPKRDVYVHRK